MVSVQDKYISTKCTEIEDLLRESKNWAGADAKLGAHLATYINVMILGMLEVCFEYLVEERAGKPGDLEIKRYIAKDIENRFRNPNYGQICGILGQFSDTYKDEFQKTFDSNCLEIEALRSILENKKNAAHYGLANLKLSISDVEAYFKGVLRILEKLEDLLIMHP